MAQRNALFCREIHLPAEEREIGNCTLQEAAGNCTRFAGTKALRALACQHMTRSLMFPTIPCGKSPESLKKTIEISTSLEVWALWAVDSVKLAKMGLAPAMCWWVANHSARTPKTSSKSLRRTSTYQQVLNPTPLNPTPATCHKPKRKLRCSFRNAALQKLDCNIGFSAVQMSFGPKAALQQVKNCSATLKRLRCRKVALSCRLPSDFKLPRLGTHV